MDWDKLLTRINKKSCVPIIGAGASEHLVPRAGEMAEILLEIHEKNQDQPDDNPCPAEYRGDLSKVTQYLAVVHEDGNYPKYKIADLVKERCEIRKPKDDDPHLALAELNLPIYITTNYDNLMQQTLEQKPYSKNVHTDYCRWTEKLRKAPSVFDDDCYEPSSNCPLVFHLHGKMDIDESLVASEDDYLDFLVEMGKSTSSQTMESNSAHQFLPPPVQRTLANDLLLFIGYGIADINFRTILRGLKTSLRSSAKTSFTVQYMEDAADELKSYLYRYFRWTLDLEMFWGTPTEFGKELLKRLR